VAAPAEKSAIKLIYGGAFRSPNAYELYYQSPGLSESNLDLKPEKIKTYELVFEQYLGDHLNVSAGAFYYRITDLISYATDAVTGLAQYQNIEGVTARGGEVELEGKWRNGVEGRASYTIQRAVNTVTDEPLTNSPAQQAKLNFSAPLFSNKVFAGAEEQYMSRRRTESGSYAGGFCVTNLTLSARNMLDRLELSVSVYNLFDKEYADAVSLDFLQSTILQDGRSYRFQIVYAF